MVFEKVVHAHRVFDEGVDKEKTEEKKEEGFDDFTEKISLPRLHYSNPFERRLRLVKEKRPMIIKGAK